MLRRPQTLSLIDFVKLSDLVNRTLLRTVELLDPDRCKDDDSAYD